MTLPTNVTLYIKDFYGLSLNDFISGIFPDFRLKIFPPQFVGFFGYVSAFWSITIEIFFYIFVPFVFLLCKKMIVKKLIFY